MLLSARTARRAVAGAVGTSAIAGAMLFGALPSAMAEDPALNPPNCTAADLAGVPAGSTAARHRYPALIAAATSADSRRAVEDSTAESVVPTSDGTAI